MDLDVSTMFVVTITVTAVLGLLLLYSWHQHRKIQALAWWGFAHLIASVAVLMLCARGLLPDFWSIEAANALLFIAAGMVWTGARVFDGNRISVVGIFGGAFAWLIAARGTDFLQTSDGPVVFSSMIIACYTFGTAIEFWGGRKENLLSRTPLVVMLSMHGALHLVRIPLALLLPISSNNIILSPTWFGVIGLESLLFMIATAFILLAMAKERAELEHRTAAMIDPLTGIANRRAFLDAALRRLKQRTRDPQPVSVLLFDLDRFKSINDCYGHPVGDRVLRIFSDIAVSELRSTDLLGRLGGEEFGAILFGADTGSAAATAERIRQGFAATRATFGGRAIDTSVSVGVATVPAHAVVDVETLLSHADEALYVAKARGRNRVEVADSYAGLGRPRRSMERTTLSLGEGHAPQPAQAKLGLVPAPGIASGAPANEPVADVPQSSLIPEGGR